MTTRRNVLTKAGGLAVGMLAAPPIVRADDTSTIDLLLDNSRSMQANVVQLANGSYLSHAFIQRQGHISALESKDIAQALIAKRIELRFISWHEKADFFGSVRIESRHDLEKAVRIIRDQTPARSDADPINTFHDVAVAYALNNPPASKRHIIDISTDDAIANRNVFCKKVQERAEAMGVMVNVLALCMTSQQIDAFSMFLLTSDGFLESEDSWMLYPGGFRRKLEREVLAA